MKKERGIINTITDWESWPFELLYFPLSIFWVWYMVRSRAVWFFTPSNPRLTFGGFEGEPKKEMYELLPKESYPVTFYVMPGCDFYIIQENLLKYNIAYPFIVKPEVGGQGILLRKIDNEAELIRYHSFMPWQYIIQSLVSYPMEVSVFYIRHPASKKGAVTGFLHKTPLYVTGNGNETLEALVNRHPKGERRKLELFSKHTDRWNDVLKSEEKYMLSYAANHNRGAQFIDLSQHIDDKLVAVFDNFSLRINDFFYGRYDIMCNSVEDLKAGLNFTILEYNGSGAEPNHFYDTGYSLLKAYKEILKHWKALYQISKYNCEQGIRPWGFNRGRLFLAEARRHAVEMKEVDNRIG